MWGRNDRGAAGRSFRGGHGRVGCTMSQRSHPMVPFCASPHAHTNSTQSLVQFPCPSPTSAPATEGQPMTHCIVDFGVFGRPSSTCLTLTATTAAAVTRLVWGRLDGRLTSWQVNIGIIHMFKTHATISQRGLIFSSSSAAVEWGLLRWCTLCVGFNSCSSSKCGYPGSRVLPCQLVAFRKWCPWFLLLSSVMPSEYWYEKKNKRWLSLYFCSLRRSSPLFSTLLQSHSTKDSWLLGEIQTLYGYD